LRKWFIWKPVVEMVLVPLKLQTPMGASLTVLRRTVLPLPSLPRTAAPPAAW